MDQIMRVCIIMEIYIYLLGAVPVIHEVPQRHLWQDGGAVRVEAVHVVNVGDVQDTGVTYCVQGVPVGF